jgi:hypothetical protein
VSWSFDPQASFVDAFTIPWASFSPYIFPPFSLLGKIIMKLINDMVERAILVVPFFILFLSGWYCPECGSVTRSVCLGSLTGKEIKIEIRDENQLCAGQKGTTKIALSTMSFINLVSGNPSLVEDFHQNLQTSSSLLGDRLQLNNTNILGENMYFGVIKGAQIPFDRLKRM